MTRQKPQRRSALREGHRKQREPHAALELAPVAGASAGLTWAIAGLVAAAALLAHWNTLQCGYVNWDDTGYIGNNPLVTGDGGLSRIWLDVFSEKPVMQYYPLVFTSFWIEHGFWQTDPAGYHAMQLALHALNAALIFLALKALGMPLIAAGAAAALFAVHPINVASVAWLPERKNTLSGVFFWLALIAYVQFRRRGGRWRYAAALGCYLLALFSKTAVVVLAPMLIVSDWLLDRRWTIRAWWRAMPFFALGLLMSRVTAHVEAINAKSGTPIDLPLRPLVAASALCHYIVKLFAPVELIPVYPRWPESYSYLRYWLSLSAVAGAAILLWRLRSRLPRRAIWAIALFVLAVFPMLGFVHFNYLQSSFVSDHFMYLSSVGPFLLVGLLVGRLVSPAEGTSVAKKSGEAVSRAPQAGGRRLAGAIVALVFVVGVLGWLTVRQNRAWRNPVTFWEHTLSGNRDCFPANYNLGNYYNRRRDYAAALPYYLEAARIDPTLVRARRSCARCCRELHLDEEAAKHYLQASELEAKKFRRSVVTRAEAAEYLQRIGRTDEALRLYEEIIAVRPEHEQARQAVERIRAGERDSKAGSP